MLKNRYLKLIYKKGFEMKKKGFTYLEVMIAITVFSVLALLVVRLNIAANRNMNAQIERQNMMMVAQKLMEKTKTTTTGVGTYVGEDSPYNYFEQLEGYYVVVQLKDAYPNQQGPTKLHEITVRVRKQIIDKKSEVVLTSHYLEN
jgi:prepilin-type N-terminal cleavage/methylation domain-containing protein